MENIFSIKKEAFSVPPSLSKLPLYLIENPDLIAALEDDKSNPIHLPKEWCVLVIFGELFKGGFHLY